MFFFIGLWLAADTSPITTFVETEIYTNNLEREQVAIGDDGQVYIANRAENQIIHYSADGKEIGRIGGKGKGPGEFEFLNDLFYQKGKLMAFDIMNDRINVYQSDGTFLHELRTQGRALRLAKAENGWLAASLFSMNPDNPPKLSWFDEKFENKRTVLELPGGGQGMIRINGLDGGKVKFNPVRDGTILASHPDHRFIFLKQPGDFLISVIDGQTGELVREIKRDEKKIPFNEEFGNKVIETMNKNASNGPIKLEYEGDFPKYFPVIRDILVNGDGLLVIRRWTGKPDEKERLLVLDDRGQEASLGYPDQLFDRVVAERGEDVYLTASGESDEVILIRCPRDQATKVAEAHPLRAGEDESRIMFRMQ